MTIYKKTLYSEITFLEGFENYSFVHQSNGKKTLSSYTLLRHEERLEDFVRVNRSYLVNPIFIKELNLSDTTPHIIMKCGKVIKIPRRRVKVLIQVFYPFKN